MEDKQSSDKKKQWAHLSNKRFPSMNNLAVETLVKEKENNHVSKSKCLHHKTPEKEDEKITKDTLFQMMPYTPSDVSTIQRKIVDHVEYTLARDRGNFDLFGAYQATAHATRDRLIEFWNDARFRLAELNPKRIYYLSIEYLLGRLLQNCLLNLGVEENYGTALKQLGYNLEDIFEQELDAGLGNGGLGRLAACYLDSAASQNFPVWGYGIRYTYGMFKQDIFQGWQAETPDTWLNYGYPFEIVRYDMKFPVRFYGEARHGIWSGGEIVIAVAHDIPIPGFRTRNTINLRLWASHPSTEFDLSSFNEGNYYKAVERRQQAETISSVLYPNDNTPEGKELRLKQQYFFTSATMQDVVRRFKKYNPDWNTFPEKVGVQLNDTHPTLAVPELIRIFVDIEGLPLEQAYDITKKTFAYTNHTVMPEALERWSVPLMERVLPRHLQIIYQINHDFLQLVESVWPGNAEMQNKLSIVEEGNPKHIRMAHLAIVMSHTVNGVAEIHSNILRESLFKEFSKLYPEKLINITNGVTPRRWLLQCNPKLTQLITERLGTEEYLNNLDLLSKLKEAADDKVKQQNKQRLVEYLRKNCNIFVDANALFDVQIKRIHEYKRQFLNIMRVIYDYIELKRRAETRNTKGIVPRVVIFGGKAAPGYHRAKLIIKLINSVAERVNADNLTKDLLKVVFVPNYNVSLAEIIIPASDISQHISTAGYEASGTSNMKFALNGGLIIGTLDGANIEIRDSIGHENMFVFGLTTDQIAKARQHNHSVFQIKDPRLQEAVDAIRKGLFGDPNIFNELCDALKPAHDFYLVGDDFGGYLEAHQRIFAAYQDKSKWAKMSILSTAGMGKFSSDRSITEYARRIWHCSQVDFNDTNERTPKGKKNQS